MCACNMYLIRKHVNPNLLNILSLLKGKVIDYLVSLLIPLLKSLAEITVYSGLPNEYSSSKPYH